MDQYNIGVIGLGVMGQNLALNIQSKGFSVAGFDLDPEKTKTCGQKWAGKKMTAASSLPDLAGLLERPRRILMMVPAGKAVDSDIAALKPLLQPDDILIDGGNSHFSETERRCTAPPSCPVGHSRRTGCLSRSSPASPRRFQAVPAVAISAPAARGIT
jgi:6-phosphogluconate dehydrogenase